MTDVEETWKSAVQTYVKAKGKCATPLSRSGSESYYGEYSIDIVEDEKTD
jgi:hypothetical protein